MSKEVKNILLIGGVIVVIAGILIGVAKYQAANKPLPEEALVRSDSASEGPEDAAVTLVEFGDFQCPACAQAKPIIDQITEEYQGKIRFVYRYFPLAFHANAPITAQAAEAARLQDKFWPMYDLLYDNQSEWVNQSDPTGTLKRYAQQAGLDVDQFTKDLTSQEVKAQIKADQKDGQVLEVNGTPTFYLNGKKLDNYSYDYLKQQIDQLLKEDPSQATPSATPTGE